MTSGAGLWRYDTGDDGERATFHADLAMVGDLVVVVASDGSPDSDIYAFERSSGLLVWQVPWPDGVSSELLSDGKRVYAVGAGVKVLALDVATGKAAWTLDLAPQRPTRARPVLRAGHLFVALEEGQVYAIDTGRGVFEWRRDLGGAVNPAVAVSEGTVFVADHAGAIWSLDARTGEIRERLPLDGIPYGAMLLAENLLLVQVAPGSLLSGDRVHWGTKDGRWRLHPADSKLYFAVTGSGSSAKLTITEAHLDGSKSLDSYTLAQVGGR